MACPVYTREKLNYFRICHVVTDILPQGLRSIFKQEWDSRYQATLGEWKDTPQNGLDFYNRESPRSRTRDARLLETIRNGNRAQWDCTTLFFAILYSNSIGHGLGAAVRSSVDDLREFRNDEFAHLPHGQLSDLQFRLAVRKVENAFRSLGLSVGEIRNICKQKTFPTEELQNVLKNVQTFEEQHRFLEEQHHILAEQLHSDVSSFCILPPKPSHEIAPREGEVCKITKQLERLREGNENGLSYLYISGNPGSGKSQLAGLVAQKFYKATNKDLKSPTFVMTLNAENSKTLLESYASLARHIKCPEYTIMRTLNSTKMQFEEKVSNLKDLIATKISLYSSWLLVVDNVSSLSDTHDFLPRYGDEQWTRGLLLITTQNTSSIPSESSFVSHISVSEGMVPTDACCFLAKVSGIGQLGVENDVAKALDYQPLALASAAVYVQKIRQSQVGRDFGWKEYLDKLEKGMRAITEKELTKTNPSYKKSMTVATRLAIERALNNDAVLKSAFTLLSLCSPQPLHLDIVMNYILNDNNLHLDKEEIALQIQGYSLLMFEEREKGIFASVHRVVHEVSKSVINECREHDEHVQSVALAVMSFNQFVDSFLPQTWNEQNSVCDSEHLISHLCALAVKVENFFLLADKYRVIKEGVFNHSDLLEYFRRFAIICRNHCEFSGAKVYCETALKLVENIKASEGGDRADIYSLFSIILWKMGELKQAKEYCERALDINLKELGPKHVAVVATYNVLGLVHRGLGDLKSSKENHERALDIQLKNLGTQHVDVANTYHHLGNVQHNLGNLDQAMEYYERALEIQVENLGHDHIYVAFSFSNMGVVESELGNLQQAKEYFVRTLDIRLKALGTEHVDVARSYYDLGVVQYELGDLQEAKKCYERALNIRLKKLGPEKVAVVHTLYELGDVQCKLGDLQQAKEYYERVLGIELKKLGPEHVDLVSIYLKLGMVQSKLGNLKQTKEYHERALAVRLKNLESDHVDMANSYHHLGNVEFAMNNVQQAKDLYERALEIQLKNLEPDHVYVAFSYEGLGSVQRKLGVLGKAKEYYKRALKIRLKRLGPVHIDVAFTHHNLGMVQRELCHLQKAKKHLKCALDITLKKLGPEHADVARIYDDLGNVQYDLGELQEAAKHCECALNIRLKKLGPEHAEVASSYHNLGYVQCQLGDLQNSKECYEQALAIRQKTLGCDHIDMANTYHHLGVVECQLGDLQQARKCHQQALDIRLKNLGPEHVDMANSYHYLGNVLFAMNDMQQAKELHERALDIQLKNLEPDHLYVAFSLHNLGEVQRELGNLVEAKENYERALKIRLEKLGTRHGDVQSTLHELCNVRRALRDLQHGGESHEGTIEKDHEQRKRCVIS